MERLIVCDIDNTLLPAGGRISEATLAALRELPSDTGFSIATGRSFHVVRKFVEDLSLRLPVITSNGAQVYDYENETSIYESCLDPKVARKLLSRLLSEDYDFVAYADVGIYFRPKSEHLDFFRNYNESVRPALRAPMVPLAEDDLSSLSNRITKVLVYFPEKALTDSLRKIPELEITASMSRVIDIMASGSTKGNAVRALAGHLGVDLSHVYCFGDNENDISMFTCGAVGIAMGNASEETKSYAAMVTRNCKDDGVAYAIRHLL